MENSQVKKNGNSFQAKLQRTKEIVRKMNEDKANSNIMNARLAMTTQNVNVAVAKLVYKIVYLAMSSGIDIPPVLPIAPSSEPNMIDQAGAAISSIERATLLLDTLYPQTSVEGSAEDLAMMDEILAALGSIETLNAQDPTDRSLVETFRRIAVPFEQSQKPTPVVSTGHVRSKSDLTNRASPLEEKIHFPEGVAEKSAREKLATMARNTTGIARRKISASHLGLDRPGPRQSERVDLKDVPAGEIKKIEHRIHQNDDLSREQPSWHSRPQYGEVS